MYIPIPITPMLGNGVHLLRPHQLRADLHRAVPMHYPPSTVDSVSTTSLVWGLIGIAICAAVLGLVALSRTRQRTRFAGPPSGYSALPRPVGKQARPQPPRRAV